MSSKKPSLFQRKEFTMHSGGTAHYKIECDALTDEDIETLAWMISQKGKFKGVYGVPTGGLRLAKALEQYIDSDGAGVQLIVDDVLSTGASMEEARTHFKGAIGIVIFARGSYPNWIKPIFEMHWLNVPDDFRL